MKTFMAGAAAALTILGGVAFTSSEANAAQVDGRLAITTAAQPVRHYEEREYRRPIRRHYREVRFEGRGHHYGWERGRGNPHRRVIRERVIRESDD